MEMRTGAASPPAPASPPSLSFSNHWFFFRGKALAVCAPHRPLHTDRGPLTTLHVSRLLLGTAFPTLS